MANMPNGKRTRPNVKFHIQKSEKEKTNFKSCKLELSVCVRVCECVWVCICAEKGQGENGLAC